MTRWLVELLVLATGAATAAPVPKALKRAKPLRATIEPLPGEKVYSVDWDDVPFAKVVEDVENQTGLICRTSDLPKVKIRLKVEKVCMSELFALLDDELYPQGWVMSRKSASFSILAVDDLGNAKVRESFPIVVGRELARRSPYQPVRVNITIGVRDIETVDKIAAGIDGPGFHAKKFGPDQYLLSGRVMDLQKFVDAMGDQIKK